MARFEDAIGYVLDNEGGYTNDPADHGGATNYGITDAEARRHGYSGDMRDLPLETAKAIYLADYWRFDGIEDQHVATKLLDMAVNMGLSTAVKLAQGIAGVVTDGVMGPATETRINTLTDSGTSMEHSALLLTGLVFGCVRRYAHIVGSDHSQAAFIVGWIERALKMPEVK
jgi:lysozyme family protein